MSHTSSSADDAWVEIMDEEVVLLKLTGEEMRVCKDDCIDMNI